MVKKLTFTRPATLVGLAESKATERELKRAHKFFKRGDLIPESIRDVANAVLADRARSLSFASGRNYAECVRELLHREPHLRLGVGAYLRDKEFSGIEFVEEAETDDQST